ncbi:MAG: PA2779 family protein [Gammaproteobacteria bacterium]|nr:PA2779 family protein [Gammaproteobacteria bacterium]
MTYIRKFSLIALLWFSVSSSFAAMVPTADLRAEPQTAPMAGNLDQRNHVKAQLIELGVDPVDASKRVNQMTDRQISTLQGEIAKLPTGAGMSTTNLLLLVIILILLL